MSPKNKLEIEEEIMDEVSGGKFVVNKNGKTSIKVKKNNSKKSNESKTTIDNPVVNIINEFMKKEEKE